MCYYWEHRGRKHFEGKTIQGFWDDHCRILDIHSKIYGCYQPKTARMNNILSVSAPMIYVKQLPQLAY